MTRIERAAVVAVLLVAASPFAACARAKDASEVQESVRASDVDGDPVALLPGGAVAVVRLDVRAMVAAHAIGPELVALLAAYAPGGTVFGVDPNRDLDEVVAGAYSFQGVDVAAVVRGRFDPTSIEAQADASAARAASGNAVPTLLVKSSYAGHALYTVANVGFCVLSAHTALAGTEAGVRRSLDKIQGRAIARDLDAKLDETLAKAVSAHSALAAAASFSSQPFPIVVPFARWLQPLTSARVVASFEAPGVKVAGELAYPDAATAQAGADGVKQVAAVTMLLPMVPTLQNLDVNVVSTDVDFAFAVNDGQLRKLVQQVGGWLPAAPAPAATPSPSSASPTPTPT